LIRKIYLGKRLKYIIFDSNIEEMETPAINDPRLATLYKAPKETILNGITLYETVDLQTLEKLINSDLLKLTFNNKICKVWHDNEKQQLEKYRDKMVAGRIKIQYNKSRNMPYGRSNPENGVGLYNIRREIRHTLASENYTDIDIDNAHPSLLLQKLNQAGISAPCLTAYVNNRPEWLDMVIKHYKINNLEKVKAEPHLIKDIPKDLFIRILFGGGFKAWSDKWGVEAATPNTKIVEFIMEVEKINEWIVMANPLLLEIAKKNKPDSHNINGTACSYYLQECEIQVLEVIYKYCVRNKYIRDDNAVLCADGLMIEKKYYEPMLLAELEEEIRNNTEFNLKLSNKEMNLGYNEILDKHLKFSYQYGQYSTAETAYIFSVLYMNKFVYVDGNLYEYTGVYWKKESDNRNTAINDLVQGVFLKYITKVVARMIAETTEEAKADSEFEKKMKRVNAIMSDVIKNINSNGNRKALIDDIIYAITRNYVEMDSQSNLVAFNNGIYDLDKAAWIKPKYNQYISMSCGWNWNFAGADHKCLDVLLNKIFPNPKIRDHYLMILSTGLWGTSTEKIINAKGEGGNGKGLLNELMMSAVGDYGYTAPSTIFISEIKEGANPAIANLHKKRFVVGSEPEENKKINTSAIKTITGGATVNCRGLYSSNCNTQLALTLIMECNTQPKFDAVNDAVARRLDVIPFVSSFKGAQTYEDDTRGMTAEEIKASNIHVANAYFKSKEFQIDNRQALIEMCFSKFEIFRQDGYAFINVPDECREASKAYMSMSDDLSNWFADSFEEDITKMIFVKEIYSKFTSSEYYINLSKQEKRDNNLGKFTQKIQKNLFMRKYFKEARSYHNGVRYLTPFIVGFCEKGSKQPATINEFDDEQKEEQMN
jgi:P4 family phage/plasmid primase-like protien